MAVLVLGIGNLIMTDDGIGVRVVQRLAASYRFPSGVTVVDGGTLGLDLLPMMEGVDRLLIIDAVETGGAPGTLVRLAGDEIPVAFRTKLSPHQMGLQDLLAVAELQGNLPGEMVLWGVQPESVEVGMELTAAVAAREELLEDEVLAELAGWGIAPEPVTAP
ncbi:HyaD/HybD family hydrogenase maturation endopeptidase [Geobacter pickeringii]|uniref:Membrane protein n=1 Tax=Geobacter pickeringii TaxID=345632 RepID=A0A0B5BCR6_9BACT|nr:HyaD/HybD family hydrogenase maturation endopeptidase [Geobacter pickeringii]AJE04523.1 membrane protein [Geobacter pickeringii]